MQSGVSNSKFHMWRTLFAVVHADEKITSEEVHFVAEALEDIPFNEAQRRILEQDFIQPQDPESMFLAITDPEDRAEFFKRAEELVWADGDFDAREQGVMLSLLKSHIKTIKIDNLMAIHKK